MHKMGRSKRFPLFNGYSYKTECGFNIIATNKSLKSNGFCDDCGKPIEVEVSDGEAKG
jgi:hypothetical protein